MYARPYIIMAMKKPKNTLGSPTLQKEKELFGWLIKLVEI